MPLALKISKRLFQNQRKGKLIFGASVWKRKCKHGKDNSALFLVFSLWMINLREKFWRPDKSKQEKNWVYSQSRPNIELYPILFNLLHFGCVEYFAATGERWLFEPNYWFILKPSQAQRIFDTCASYFWSYDIIFWNHTNIGSSSTYQVLCLPFNKPLPVDKVLKDQPLGKTPFGKTTTVSIIMTNIFDFLTLALALFFWHFIFQIAKCIWWWLNGMVKKMQNWSKLPSNFDKLQLSVLLLLLWN